MYFLMVLIDFSFVDSMNSFHVLYLAFFTFQLYSLHFVFQSNQSTLLPVLLCRFLTWFSIFLDFVRSSFHHLLLKGDGFLHGVVSAIALPIASVNSLAKLSIPSSVVSVCRSARGRR